ncbi:hypothetical protein BH09ACT9_BH09ACT9_00920 [soil metagenome]
MNGLPFLITTDDGYTIAALLIRADAETLLRALKRQGNTHYKIVETAPA